MTKVPLYVHYHLTFLDASLHHSHLSTFSLYFMNLQPLKYFCSFEMKDILVCVQLYFVKAPLIAQHWMTV